MQHAKILQANKEFEAMFRFTLKNGGMDNGKFHSLAESFSETIIKIKEGKEKRKE